MLLRFLIRRRRLCSKRRQKFCWAWRGPIRILKTETNERGRELRVKPQLESPARRIVLERVGLFRPRATAADNEAGCEPNVVLVRAKERMAVVVGVKNAHGKMGSEIEVHTAAHFHRETQISELRAAGSTYRVVHMRAAHQRLRERTGAPGIALAVKYARAIVVSIRSEERRVGKECRSR